MDRQVSVTALVTPIPSFVRSPSIGSGGETLLQFLVRQYPQEWRNLVERLVGEHSISNDLANALRTVTLTNLADSGVVAEVERWRDDRLPTLNRTLMCLAEFREMARDRELGFQVKLVQVIVAVGHGSEHTAEATKHRQLGAEVIALSAGPNWGLSLLPHIRGAYLWYVPGGSRVFAHRAVLGLDQIVSKMEAEPRCGAYFDGSYSVIYRLSALKDVGNCGRMPAELRERCRMLQELGYLLWGDFEAQSEICQFEQIYGGSHSTGTTGSAKSSSWLGRLFGR